MFLTTVLTINGWRKLIVDNDGNNLFTESDIFCVKNKVKYQFHIINTALKLYSSQLFSHCVQTAISKIEHFESSDEIDDITYNVHPKTAL